MTLIDVKPKPLWKTLVMADEQSHLELALIQFERTEANLDKLEALWSQIVGLVPQGIAYADLDPAVDENYNRLVAAFEDISSSMPALDDLTLEINILALDEIANNRSEALEVDVYSARVEVEAEIRRPGRQLAEYRQRLRRLKRQVVRDRGRELIESMDRLLAGMAADFVDKSRQPRSEDWSPLRHIVDELSRLIGDDLRPPRWGDLRRHLSFAQLHDLDDIINMDWPAARPDLEDYLYDPEEALPVEVDDLASLVRARPTGPVSSRLQWPVLEAESFERLIYDLVDTSEGYENANWLMKTNAQDHGRDVEVYRVHADALAGTIRERIIIQCKHWLSKSVALADLASCIEVVKLWEPPRIDVLVVATSGRFTQDALKWAEQRRDRGDSPRIELWSDSRLESLLAARSDLRARYRLQ